MRPRPTRGGLTRAGIATALALYARALVSGWWRRSAGSAPRARPARATARPTTPMFADSVIVSRSHDWSEYGYCWTCLAGPGVPCRQADGKRARKHPHRGRGKREALQHVDLDRARWSAHDDVRQNNNRGQATGKRPAAHCSERSSSVGANRRDASNCERSTPHTTCHARAGVPSEGESAYWSRRPSTCCAPREGCSGTRQAQRAPRRAVRAGRLPHLSPAPVGERGRCGPGAVRAPDTPRPGPSVMRRAWALRTSELPTVGAFTTPVRSTARPSK